MRLGCVGAANLVANWDLLVSAVYLQIKKSPGSGSKSGKSFDMLHGLRLETRGQKSLKPAVPF